MSITRWEVLRHRLLINGRLVNAFGYWQGQKITNATATYLDDLQQAIGHIQELSGSIDGIEIWNGETGWPADGMSHTFVNLQLD